MGMEPLQHNQQIEMGMEPLEHTQQLAMGMEPTSIWDSSDHVGLGVI